MNERIKKLRKDLNLTQEDFSSRIGLSRNFIAQIEIGTKRPSDRTISDICREFNINEDWLRTGNGKMYNIPEDETAAIVSDLLEEDNPFYDIIKGIMKTYQKLDDKSQSVLLEFSQELLNNLKKRGH